MPADLPLGTNLGDRAPRLVGSLATGEPFELNGFATAPKLLVFYRGAQCGLCRVQLQQLETNLNGYRRKGIQIIAITLDPPDRSRVLLDELSLRFDLVSADSATFAIWGAMDPNSSIALPATFIIDRQGLVRYRHIGRNAADRALDVEILTMLESMDPL